MGAFNRGARYNKNSKSQITLSLLKKMYYNKSMTKYHLNPLKNNLHMYDDDTLWQFRESKREQLRLARDRLIKQKNIVTKTEAYVRGLESDIHLYGKRLMGFDKKRRESNTGEY